MGNCPENMVVANSWTTGGETIDESPSYDKMCTEITAERCTGNKWWELRKMTIGKEENKTKIDMDVIFSNTLK